MYKRQDMAAALALFVEQLMDSKAAAGEALATAQEAVAGARRASLVGNGVRRRWPYRSTV